MNGMGRKEGKKEGRVNGMEYLNLDF